MKTVFLGTPQTAVPTLEALIEAGYPPQLVVTRPDRPVGRGRISAAPPVKQAAERHGLEVFQPEKVRGAGFLQRLDACRPDFLIVVAYGRILPRSVLDLPGVGPVNLHFSLLPAYRGAAPVQWALARGETTTGVCTIVMNERMDEGDIVLERPLRVEPGEHAPELSSRLATIGAEVMLETLERLSRGAVTPRPQDESRATYAPMLEREDGFVSPTLSAPELDARVRGFDPWPGVWLARGETRLRLRRTRLHDGQSTESPGSLTEVTDDGVVMSCGGGTTLVLLEVQPAGRRPVKARDALNGRQLAVGDRLGPLQVPG